jgi:hypothetical protein
VTLPLELAAVPADRRISQCFTWLFVIVGALLLLFGAYLASGEPSPSRIEWQIGAPCALAGLLLLAYDLRRRATRVSLVLDGDDVGVYRGGQWERTGAISEFVNRGSRFSVRAMLRNTAALQLAVLSTVVALGAVLAAFVFASLAVFGHFGPETADSLKERVFALLTVLPLLALVVNLVLAGFYRVEVVLSPAAGRADGFALLFRRSAARRLTSRR